MEKVLIIDGKNSAHICRHIRKLGVYAEVCLEDDVNKAVKEFAPKAVLYCEQADDLGLNIAHTVYNADTIEQWLFNEQGFKRDWHIPSYTEQTITELRKQYEGKKVLCALSGGVDSTVCAVLMSKAIGRNLTCVFVDTGLMRLNEGKEVAAMMERFDINFISIDAEARFLGKLKGVTEPETKRKIVGEEFIRVFEEEATKLGEMDYLLQGTIYPDILESGTKSAALIKSHHNVGGLPERINFKGLVEPLKNLFKDEVREMGTALGIDNELVYRQPFPGPGLSVRCIGEVTKEKLDVLREADFVFRAGIKKNGLDKQIWQYFAVMTGLRSTGIYEEQRSYGYTVALRAVLSVDAMSAKAADIPMSVLFEISKEITDKVKEVNRVVYDVTSKPPSTIEWE